MTRLGHVMQRAAGALLPSVLGVLSPIEAARLRRVDTGRAIAAPPVFIVGAPRTGSTVLYQVITNALDVAYLSNLAALMYRSLYLGLRAHAGVYGTRAHDCFESRYGRTSGLAAPSETGKLWYRWFPRDRDCIEAGDVDTERLTALRAAVAATTADLGRNVVFKNLNNGQRLRVLQPLFPEALVIFVRRDPLATACSLLAARRRLRGSADEWLSVRPCDVERLRTLPWPDQIAGQVHSLERRIEADLALFPDGQVLRIRYEALCGDVGAAVDAVEALLAANGPRPARRPGASLPRLHAGAPVADPEDISLLHAAVARLDWPGADAHAARGAAAAPQRDG